MGSLRKYLFNGAVISSITSGLSAFRAQRKSPNDWRTALSWVGWAVSLIVTVGTVRIDSRSQEVDPAAPTGKGGRKPRKGATQKVPTALSSETRKLITGGQKSQKKARKAAVKQAKKNAKAESR